MLLFDLFLLRDTPYRYACENPKSPRWMPFLFVGVGSFYGFLVALFQKSVGIELHGIAVDQIPNLILFGGNVISGIFVALFFHGGVTLLVWFVAKGVGGPGRLAVLYRAMAFLLPLTLPALPYLAARSALAGGAPSLLLPYNWCYTLLAAYAFIVLIIGLFKMFRVTQEIAVWRCSFAVFLLILFSVAVLIL